MTDQFAYSSETPEALTAWAEYTDARMSFRAELDALEAETGLKVFTYGRSGEVAGLKPDPEVATPAGWRLHKDHDMLVPDKRTKVGKEWAKLLSEMRGPRGCSLPGCPSMLLRDSYHWYEPGVFAHEGTVWVFWGTNADDDMEPQFWTKRLLSEFYAAREAIEAAEKVTTSV